MQKCGEYIATKLTADTVIAEDCRGNAIYAGNAIATCEDLATGGGADNYVDGATLSGNNLVISRTGTLPDIVVDLSALGGGGGVTMNLSTTMPADNTGTDLPTTIYGTDRTRLLGKPNAWGEVTVGGTNYLVPLFLPL